MSFVQPIAVSKTGSHEQTVVAVGLASVLCWKESMDYPIWDEWFKGLFTKTVRRGTLAELTACKQFTHAKVITRGDCTAIGLPPMSDEVPLPKPLNRMQVTGLELFRGGWFARPEPGQVAFFINKSLDMSTGKTAAQLAHAMMGYSRLFGFDWIENFCVHDAPYLFEYYENDVNTLVRINDAGKTEIAPDSLTVIVTEI